MREKNLTVDEVETLLNKQSGLKAIAGTNDLRLIIEAKEADEPNAILALEMFCYRLRKQLGAYMSILNGVDAVIFTGGIGENSSLVRQEMCSHLAHMGILIDEEKNASNAIAIHHNKSAIKLLVLPTDEEYLMALYGQQQLINESSLK